MKVIMRVRDLEKQHINIKSMDEFKKIITEAIENEGKYKKYGYWLNEEYGDFSNENYIQYKANIICMNEIYVSKDEYFKNGDKSVGSVTIYDIFYVYHKNLNAKGFVIDEIVLSENAIKAIKSLEEEISKI